MRSEAHQNQAPPAGSPQHENPRVLDRPSTAVPRILAVQQTAGNRAAGVAVQRLIAANDWQNVILPKLTTNVFAVVVMARTP
jgi:hypothetical protein